MDVGIASPVTLESRYTDHDRPVLMSGVQALVRVMLEQSRLDRLAGLKRAGWCRDTADHRWGAWTLSCGGGRHCWMRPACGSSRG